MPPSWDARSLGGRTYLVMPTVPAEASPLIFTTTTSLIRNRLKEQAMSRKLHSLSKQMVVATALVLGASGIALADDSSMSPLTGDSYRYFNGQFNRPAL